MSNAVLFLIGLAHRNYPGRTDKAIHLYGELAKVLQKSFPHRAQAYQKAAELLSKGA